MVKKTNRHCSLENEGSLDGGYLALIFIVKSMKYLERRWSLESMAARIMAAHARNPPCTI